MLLLGDTSAGRTALTLLLGAAGAAVATFLGAPIAMLLGPAIAVSLAGLAGLPVEVGGLLRTVCFIFLGMAVGTGFDADAAAAMRRWPLAFVIVAIFVPATLFVARGALVRFFGFDGRSALLAAAPGHLSFVIAMAAEAGSDVARISVTQSVRLLLLTLVVPFLAVAMGIDLTDAFAANGATMGVSALAMLAILGVILGRGFARFLVPAPVLMGAMVVSAIAQAGSLTSGSVPAAVVQPAYLLLGCLIGTRFNGITVPQLLGGLGAGLAVTLIASGFALLAALLMGVATDMPVAHLMVAFAPGGLETMIAIGAVLGVVPGFVAACHIARLMVLSVLLPLTLSRSGGTGRQSRHFRS